MPSDTPEQIAAKAALYAEAEEAVAKLHAAADVLVSVELKGLNGKAYETEREAAADQMMAHWAQGLAELQGFSHQSLGVRHCFHWSLAFPEIMESGGFSAFIGNPPFMGGTKLEPVFGKEWRDALVEYVGNGVRGVRGTADLCAYFFMRCGQLLRQSGQMALLATNTVSEGDTRTVGLAQLVAAEFSISFAIRSMKWPGAANLEVAVVSLHKGHWNGGCVLDGIRVRAISDDLSVPSNVIGTPFQINANAGLAIEGAKNLGMGFILDPQEASKLITKDCRNKDVLFPFLNGEDVNSRPDQSATRWTIFFFEWPLNREGAPDGYDGPVAEDYPDCLKIVEERVKPERMSYPPDSSWNRSLRAKWWQYGLPRPALLKALKGKSRALVKSAVSQNNFFVLVATNVVFSHATKVFIFEDFGHFSVLQSTLHDEWARKYGSSLESRFRYTPGSCFETYPFPKKISDLEGFGMHYHEFRENLMQLRNEGLSKTYNRFHSLGENSPDIVELRRLHTELDRAVLSSYGWQDLCLDHGFHETKQGVRFTVSEGARREVLDRLLALNQQRHAEEEAERAALPVAVSAKRGRKPKDTGGQITMDL